MYQKGTEGTIQCNSRIVCVLNRVYTTKKVCMIENEYTLKKSNGQKKKRILIPHSGMVHGWYHSVLSSVRAKKQKKTFPS